MIRGTAVAALALAAALATAPAQAAEATVDASAVLRLAEPGALLGGNMAVWSSAARLQPPLDDYVRGLGTRVMRFPGGNLSNNYCWPTVRAAGNDHVVWSDWSWGTNVHQFLDFVERVGLTPMYSVNPFDHTIDGVPHSAVDEAVELVRLFASRGFPGAYFEVGNENDGVWNRMLTIEEYADRFVLLAEAMKAEDPSIRMLGPVGSGYTVAWVDVFIDLLADRGRLDLLDYLAYHTYGGWIASDNVAGIDLNQPQRLAAEVATIRAKLDSRGGVNTRIAVTEYNAAIWQEGVTREQFTIRQALWLVDFQGELFRSVELANVWITLHPGGDPHTLLDDQTEPATPTRNYWPAHLVHRTFSGATPTEPVSVVEARSDLPTSTLRLHAVHKLDGSLGILAVNKGSTALPLTLALPGGPTCGSAEALLLDDGAYQAATGPAAAPATCLPGGVAVTLPPLSASGIVVRP